MRHRRTLFSWNLHFMTLPLLNIYQLHLIWKTYVRCFGQPVNNISFPIPIQNHFEDRRDRQMEVKLPALLLLKLIGEGGLRSAIITEFKRLVSLFTGIVWQPQAISPLETEPLPHGRGAIGLHKFGGHAPLKKRSPEGAGSSMFGFFSWIHKSEGWRERPRGSFWKKSHLMETWNQSDFLYK